MGWHVSLPGRFLCCLGDVGSTEGTISQHAITF